MQLFLHFRGPAQILVQSRGAALSDALTARDVSEIADAPAGVVQQATSSLAAGKNLAAADSVKLLDGQTSSSSTPTKMSYASVNKGAVKFDQTKEEEKKL